MLVIGKKKIKKLRAGSSPGQPVSTNRLPYNAQPSLP